MASVTIFIALSLITIVTAVKICPPGFYLQGSAHCVKCTLGQCTGGQVVVQQCTPTTNFECGCPEGKFFDTHKHICFKCTIPEEGWIFRRNCSKFENSKVEKCPEGTYTDIFKSYCKNCTKYCASGVLQNCSISANTICKVKDLNKRRNGSNKTEIIVGASFGIFIVIVLMIFGFCWYWRRRTPENQRQGIDAEGSYKQSVDSLSAKSSGEMNGNIELSLQEPEPSRHNQRKATYQRANSNISVANGAINPLTDGNQPVTITEAGAKRSIVWKHTSLEHLSYDSRQRLSLLLYPKTRNDWKTLADYLGYTDIEIRNFAMASDGCVEMLLQSYEGKKGANIPALHQALVNIERHDAAEVLEIYQESA